MNFTGGNTLPTIGRRITWQVAALAGGLALLSAGALSGVFDRDGAPASTPATQPLQPPAVTLAARTAGQPTEAVYLLVGSQTGAAELNSVISAYAATDDELARQAELTNVVVIENREQEDRFNTTLAISSGELMASGLGLRVIDLREPVSPSPAVSSTGRPTESFVYIVGSQAERIALEQQFHESGATFGDQIARDVFVADTAEQQALAQTLIGEQLATGTFTVVDLR